MATSIQFLNPSSLAKPNGFTHVTTSPPGSMVFVSGQVSYDCAGNIVGANDLGAQTRQIFENLKVALNEANSDFSHILKLTFFVKGLSKESMATIRRVRAGYLSESHPPASTMVGVVALAKDELLLEVEAYAMVTSN